MRSRRLQSQGAGLQPGGCSLKPESYYLLPTCYYSDLHDASVRKQIVDFAHPSLVFEEQRAHADEGVGGRGWRALVRCGQLIVVSRLRVKGACEMTSWRDVA